MVAGLAGSSSTRLSGSSPAPVPFKSWLALLSFGLNSGFNAFLCMNFSVVSSLTGDILDVGEQGIAWFYSGMLLTVSLGMPIGLALVIWWEAAGLALSVTMNALCALVRWVGVHKRSYPLCLISTVLLGAGAWTILPMPAQLSEQRFPPEKWTLTTSMAVQANFFGWMLGSLVVPLVVHDPQSMETFLLCQLASSALVLVVYAVCYRPVDAGDVARGRFLREAVSFSSAAGSSLVEALSDAAAAEGASHNSRGHAGNDLEDFLRALRTYPSLGMQLVAYGTLAGVGFAVPGCNDTILSHLGFSPRVSAGVNIAFIGSGVLSGLGLGYFCSSPMRFGVVLKTLFCLCVVALTALAALVSYGHPSDASAGGLLAVFGLAMLAGCTSLGFFGIGIEAAALYPANGTYVCFALQFLSQVTGAVFTQLSSGKDGFTTMAAAAWFTGILLLLGHRQPPQGEGFLGSGA
mmetsp:Transcript_38505/g.119810  ORF Transcript_38505/g.119810 Transcript_38505/m.119810 type:complete len:462 (+) Transcript_38505:55-1440(+)